MSNRLFQGVIQQMKDAIGRVFGIIDESETVIACSELTMIGESRQGIREELAFSSDAVVLDGYTYRALDASFGGDAIVFVEGDDRAAARDTEILAISLGNLKLLYDEKFDKSSFIKNIMLDNILPSDIYTKSKELQFTGDESRVVLVIKFQGRTEVLPYEIVSGMFPDRTRDYVINVGEQDVVLVKEVVPEVEIRELENLAETISETLSAEFLTKVSIGISTVAEGLKDLARAYKEARIALEVGKVFDTEKNVVSYENLGIGRLIYQLPITLCEIFLQEVFKKGSLESLDRETLMTVQSFFENNLNVSETSRKLFVHRNTLVYRLEKIRKLTGLDLREFDHAVTFKVALMVKKYLSSKPSKY